MIRTHNPVGPVPVHRSAAPVNKEKLTLTEQADILFGPSVEDTVFPPMQAELVKTDGTRVTKVAARESVEHRAVRVKDADGSEGSVFLGRDYQRNFIRRLNDDGTLVFSHKLSEGQSVAWIDTDGRNVYVQLHYDREHPGSGPNLFALDPKSGKVKKELRIEGEAMVRVHPQGGLWLQDDRSHRRLDADLVQQWARESRTNDDQGFLFNNGYAVVHDARSHCPIEVLDPKGTPLYTEELDAYDSPTIDGNKLWLVGQGVTVFDTDTGKLSRLPCGANTRRVVPLPGGGYFTQQTERFNAGEAAIEVHDARGGRLGRYPMGMGYVDGLHYNREKTEALAVVRRMPTDGGGCDVYRVNLTGESKEAVRVASLDKGPKGISTRVIPAFLEDGSVLVMTPEGVTHVNSGLNRLYSNLDQAGDALGGLKLNSVCYQDGIESSHWGPERILQEAAEAFPYPSFGGFPSQRFSHTDNCINVNERPGGQLLAPLKAKPLPQDTVVDYGDGHSLSLSQLGTNQTVVFEQQGTHKHSYIQLPPYRQVTAMVAHRSSEGHQTLVGTDEGMVYWADTEIRNGSVWLVSSRFDLESPVAAIDEKEDGSFLVRGENGQSLLFDPDYYQSYSLQRLREMRAEERENGVDLNFEEDGVQVGGIFLPIDS